MHRCKECGANIDEIQTNKYNGLCLKCIRSEGVSHDLQCISKRNKFEDLLKWGSMIGHGVIGTISVFVILFHVPGTSQAIVLIPLFIIFLGMIIAGCILFDKTRKM